MNKEPSPAAIEHFNRASDARENQNHDLAISEYDACLDTGPDAVMTFLSLCYLWESIFSKFDFFNREGASLSDYEAAWTLRAQGCLNKAIEIYEQNYSSFTVGNNEQMFKDYYLGTKDRSKDWFSYGGMKYDAYGEEQLRDFDAVQQAKLPTLNGLESVLNRKEEKKSSDFDFEKLISDDPPRLAKHLYGKALSAEFKLALSFDEISDSKKVELLRQAADFYERAIKIGLPQDETIESYGKVGIVLSKLAGYAREWDLPNFDPGSQNFPNAFRAKQCLEYAFYLDLQVGGNVFGNTSPSKDSLPDLTRSLLSDMLFWLDGFIAFQCDHLRSSKGDESVIPFVKEKLNNLAYLKFLPLPSTCLELAKSFYNLGDKDSAIYWLNCIVSDSEDFADLESNSSESRRNVKEKARNRIAAYNSDSVQVNNNNQYSGISLAASVAAFFLIFLFSVVATNGAGGVGCCFPLIVAIVVYFITPTIMKSLNQK